MPNAPIRNSAIQKSKKIPIHNPLIMNKIFDKFFLDFFNAKPAANNTIPITILIMGRYAIDKYSNCSIQIHFLFSCDIAS